MGRDSNLAKVLFNIFLRKKPDPVPNDCKVKHSPARHMNNATGFAHTRTETENNTRSIEHSCARKKNNPGAVVFRCTESENKPTESVDRRMKMKNNPGEGVFKGMEVENNAREFVYKLTGFVNRFDGKKTVRQRPDSEQHIQQQQLAKNLSQNGEKEFVHNPEGTTPPNSQT